MIKKILFILLVFITSLANAQSKKEQIQILSSKIDSLINLINNERNLISLNNKEYEDKINNYKKEFEFQNNTIKALSIEIKKAKANKDLVNIKLSEEINRLKDSLNNISLNKATNQTTLVNEIEFSYSDMIGKQFLIDSTETIGDPNKFTIAIADKGICFDVGFVKMKKEKSETGRKSSNYFKDNGGYLFALKSGSIIDHEGTIILLSKAFMLNRVNLKINNIEKKELSNSIKQKIESDKGRKIKNYRGLTRIDENRSIYLFEFNIKNDSALATLAFITPNKIIYYDFVAAYDPEGSTWRVDDSGEFDFGINVLCVFEKQGIIEVIIDWPGTEGCTISYIKEKGEKFIPLKQGYRYYSP